MPPKTSPGSSGGPSRSAQAADGGRNGAGRFPIGRPLPNGRHALPAETVAAVQRERLLRSMLAVSGEIGYESLAVRDVLERAGTSRRAFYENFADKQECFLAAWGAGAAALRDRVIAAAGAQHSWRERLRLGLGAALDLLDSEPRLGRALLVEVHCAGPEARALREGAMRELAGAIDSARRDPALRHDPPAMTAEGIAGGIESAVRSRLGSGEGELPFLLPALMHVAVMPYLGAEAAAEELEAATAPLAG